MLKKIYNLFFPCQNPAETKRRYNIPDEIRKALGF